MKCQALLFSALAALFWHSGLFAGEKPGMDTTLREIPIGVLASLDGPGSEADGRIYRVLDDYLSSLSASSSLRFRLRLIPTEKRWGRQTEGIVSSIFEDGTKVIIGGTDARSAHLAAQIISRSKGAALLISLAPDRTLTQSGVPWVFRITTSSSTGGSARPENLAVKAASTLVRAFQEGASSVEEIQRFLASQPGFRVAKRSAAD